MLLDCRYAQLNNIDMNGMANQSHVHVLGGGVDPNQKADLTVVDTLQAMVPIYVTLVFALQVKTMLQHLLHEKESRIQIGLETMGLYVCANCGFAWSMSERVAFT